jgi:hypothetical protein
MPAHDEALLNVAKHLLERSEGDQRHQNMGVEQELHASGGNGRRR